MPVVDNHCHLDIADRPRERWLPLEDALRRVPRRSGVPRIVQIGCDLPGARWAVATAQRHAALVAGVALHPNEAPRLDAAGRLDEALAEIDAAGRLDPARPRRRRDRPGLLPHRARRPGRAGAVVPAPTSRWRSGYGKTLVIHDRDAHDDVLRVLEEEGAPDRTVFHCFSGDAAIARACVDRGCVPVASPAR